MFQSFSPDHFNFIIRQIGVVVDVATRGTGREIFLVIQEIVVVADVATRVAGWVIFPFIVLADYLLLLRFSIVLGVL